MSNEKLRELYKKCSECDGEGTIENPIVGGYVSGHHCCLNCDGEGYVPINTPKHETVEEWEKRTGESYPDDAPVWCIMTYTPSMHKVKPYYELVEYGTVKADKSVIVANHHGKPEIEEK